MRDVCRRFGCGALAGVLLVWAAAMPACHAADGPLVDLDASGVAPGPLEAWPNSGSAGGTFTAGGDKPAVAAVAGRQAVTLSEKQWMRSAFPAPKAITKGQPFTLCLWAYPTRLVGKQVMVSWASRPYDCAEFGYGKNREGAFCGWLRDCGYRRVPAISRWHHIAYTYAEGTLRIYVDGQLDTQADHKLSPKSGESILLGAGWDAAKKQPCFGFRGSLARVRIWDRCLSHREVRNDMGAADPFDPVPTDASIAEDRKVVLRWQNGHPELRTVRVYLGEDRRSVESGEASAGRGGDLPAGAEGKLDAGELTLGKTYFWRVEQLGAEGRRLTAGPTWTFTVSAGPAARAQPRNRVAGIARDTRELSWAPGRYAVSQTVYFGTDAEAVSRGEAVLARDLPASATKAPLPAALEYGRTYYWRLDQNNGPLPPARGDVWAFRVEDEPAAGRLTFFVIADTHYGLDWRVEPALQALVDKMNFLPGTPLPPKVGGGIVRTPRGVIHLGDITNDGKEPQWNAFVRDFGLIGENRLAWPVIELFGNHDGGADRIVRKSIVERHGRRPGLAARSANGVHCSWEWEGIRFIDLNISVGTTTRPYDPQDSLGFLRQELARLKDPRQPILLLQHFGFDKRHGLPWWPEAWRTTYYETIKDYNVVGIFHGHDHETDIFRWKGIDIYDAPHVRNADAPDKPIRHGFFVVQIEDGQLVVAERTIGDTWGLTARKQIGK